MNKSPMERYRNALADTPPPKTGQRHGHCYQVAMAAVIAGLSADEASQDWQSACGGQRPRHEMRDAWHNAAKHVSPATDHDTGPILPRIRPKPIRRISAGTIERFRERAFTDHPPEHAIPELFESSPYRLDGDPDHDLALILRTLYRPDEWVFLGGLYDKETRPVSEWLARLDGGMALPELIGPNPYLPNTTRGADNVSEPRFFIVEMDDAVIDGDTEAARTAQRTAAWERQASLLLALSLSELAAVVCSGNKSLHAWIASGATLETWADIRTGFDSVLIPLGADKAYKTPSQNSRVPNRQRQAKDGDAVVSRLWYLNPGAIAV